MSSASTEAALEARKALRQTLLARRDEFVGGPKAAAADGALAQGLSSILIDLEPELLGVYWPIRSEFNAPALLAADTLLATYPLALPFARKQPVDMHYRRWSGKAPTLRDECGILTSSGAEAVPDVVLVPCLGFTRDGFRLGYGGGYFDRWLALHPDVTAVGVAWSVGELAAGSFEPQAFDQALTLIVTEQGVV
ncbi:MAG: 5-formyltetrahydrofolate cyclo-ligase [Burkholderiales bacterium]